MKKSLLFLIGISPLFFSGCGTTETATTVPTSNHSGYVTRREVKIINGKRYVFVAGDLGSNIPGRWVPEDSPAAQLPSATGAVDRSAIQQFQGEGYR